MTWQVGAFGLLALALAAGFAWYERNGPDARIVALVGTLAAFAALGRIAFAAVPNVKPTTDIVLIAGYALGGGPGFAVGALAGLSSNFFFGQGPWTPWQMAAWGATGVVGAGLARLRGMGGAPPAPMGRWPLAIACCVAGFAFTMVQDVGDWVTYSDHSWAQLGVYVGQGLGFDAIHAAGCLAFALALGPALTRSIQRFSRRLQVSWIPAHHPDHIPAHQPDHISARAAPPGGAVGPLIAVALVAAALGPRVPAARAAGVSPATARGAAVAYLRAAENSDGGFGAAPGQPSDQLYAGWAALGLASAGQDLSRVSHGAGLLSYIEAGAGTADVGALERTILVARAAGLPARSFGGRDLVAELERRLRPDGSVSDQVNLTAFAILALRGAGAGGVGTGSRPLRWLVRQQDSDGGFSFAGAGATSDVDDTGAALQALAGDGAAAGARRRAVAFLRGQQNRDGGFPSQAGGQSNAQSTAWAIQGLDSAGVSPGGLHRDGAVSPVAYLASLAAPNGSIRYSRGLSQTPVWVTGEALMALAGKPLPVAPPQPPPPPPARPVSPAAAHPAPRGPAAPATPPSRGAAARARAHPSARPPSDHRPATAVAGLGPVSMEQLAAAAGVVTALVLAPVGLG